LRTPGPEFNCFQLAQLETGVASLPDTGELMLVRFQGARRMISTRDTNRWLSAREHQLARLHLTPALRKRFTVSRAVARQVLSTLCACDPADVPLFEADDGRLSLDLPDRQRFTVGIVYVGIWTVIAIGAAPFGLAAEGPRAPRQHEHFTAADIRHRARLASLCDALQPANFAELQLDDTLADTLVEECVACSIEIPGDGRWHVIDLPMPGSLAAALAGSQTIRRIDAFGWTRTEVVSKY
jgi:hypothetical protein